MRKRKDTQALVEQIEFSPEKHVQDEIRLDFGQLCLTHANISYLLFDKRKLQNEQFNRVRLILMDAYAEEKMCDGVSNFLHPQYIRNKILSKTLEIVVMAVIKVRNANTDTDMQFEWLLESNQKRREFQFCPIAFGLCVSNEDSDDNPGPLQIQLAVLCKTSNANTKSPPILLYEAIKYVITERKQDIELYAERNAPFLVRYYADHGFVLAQIGQGCAQLNAAYITTFNGKIEAIMPKGTDVTDQLCADLIAQLGLNPTDVIDKLQGYYMIFCTHYASRLAMSKVVSEKAQTALTGEDVLKVRIVVNWKIRRGARNAYKTALSRGHL
jgi:hypothetical protein